MVRDETQLEEVTKKLTEKYKPNGAPVSLRLS